MKKGNDIHGKNDGDKNQGKTEPSDLNSESNKPTKGKDDQKTELIKLLAAIVTLIGSVVGLVKYAAQVSPPIPISESPAAISVTITTSEPPTALPVLSTNQITQAENILSTNLPTQTDTLISTPTLTPTLVPILYDFKVGVLNQNPDCKDNKNDEIIKGLRNAGFDVTGVANNLDDYSDYTVLYMPYGWSCSADSYDLVGIRRFLNRTGTGLLIGDPKPNPAFTVDFPYLFKLFGAFTFEFYDLTPSVVNAQSAGVVFQPEDDYSGINQIFMNIPDKDLPKAETNLEIGGESGFGHVSETHRRVLFRNNTIRNHEITCILSSYEKNNTGNIHIPRYIIMPGGERKGEDNPSNEISEQLMINIIKWLAHDL